MNEEDNFRSKENHQMRWHILYTLPRMEKKLEAYLKKYEFSAYVPKIKTKSRWKDRWKIIEKPLFPSYVFIQMDYWRDRKKILNLPGVHHFIFWKGSPAEVSEEDLDLVETFLQEYPTKLQLKKNEIIKPGATITIQKGAFKGKKCEVIKVDRKLCKLIVRFPAIGQAIQVQISTEELGMDEFNWVLE